MATPVYTGGSNVYTVKWSNEDLLVAYSRNPKSFPLLNYIGLRKVAKQRGLYLKIDPLQNARVVNTTDYVWPSNQDRPTTNANNFNFSFESYSTIRRNYDDRHDFLATDQADWPLLDYSSRKLAQQAMTMRTLQAYNTITTTGNWPGSTDTVTNLIGSGTIYSPTTNNQRIKALIQAVRVKVNQRTAGAFDVSKLRMVISPILAHSLSQSAELVDFIKQTPQAVSIIEGKEFYGQWGLPSQLYGVRVIVDDTVIVTAAKKADTNTTVSGGYVWNSNLIAFFYVDDGDVAVGPPTEGRTDANGTELPSFNTITLFSYEDMTIETQADVINRRTNLNIVDDFTPVVTAPETGYLVTGVS